MASTLRQVRRELAEVQAQLRPLQERQAELLQQEMRLRSQAWAKSHRVTCDRIEVPYKEEFQLLGFEERLRQQRKIQPFFVWNDHVYLTGQLFDGTLVLYENCCFYEDVPLLEETGYVPTG